MSLGRLSFGRPSLRGRQFCPASRNCLVGQPLALGAYDRKVGALGVVHAQLDAVRISKIELAQVAFKVGFGEVEVHAENARLRANCQIRDGDL